MDFVSKENKASKPERTENSIKDELFADRSYRILFSI